MKPTTSFVIMVIAACLFYACSNKQREEHSESTKLSSEDVAKNEAAPETQPPLSSSAAVETKKDTSRKFMRTADIKFEVKNVVQATYSIEDIVAEQGGFVTYTNLHSTVNNKTVTAVSVDSSLESTYYTVENTITLRVPNTKLDTTLKAIAKHVYYLDYRLIKADDVALQLLSNKLAEQRMAKSEQRLVNAIDEHGKKLNDINASEETLLSRSERKDDAVISNLALNDKIEFSTVTLAVYQREGVLRELVANDKDIAAFTPPLTTRLRDAFMEGWAALASILVFFAGIWWLILALPLAYVGYKKLNARLKAQM